MTTAELAQFIDHTLLKPEANAAAIEKLCLEAKQFHFYSVCINPCWIETCRNHLNQSDVKVCTVIGFPLGAQNTIAKVFETKAAIATGADEIDMVVNIGFIKSNMWQQVAIDIAAVVAAAGDLPVKVILETGLLTREEKIQACQAATSAGATFVKTSTGFNPNNTTVEDVKLMKESISPHMQVKASGGVRDLKTMQAMIDAGATRIGTSSAAQFLSGNAAQGTY